MHIGAARLVHIQGAPAHRNNRPAAVSHTWSSNDQLVLHYSIKPPARPFERLSLLQQLAHRGPLQLGLPRAGRADVSGPKQPFRTLVVMEKLVVFPERSALESILDGKFVQLYLSESLYMCW